jgi:hypothetical protein
MTGPHSAAAGALSVLRTLRPETSAPAFGESRAKMNTEPIEIKATTKKAQPKSRAVKL